MKAFSTATSPFGVRVVKNKLTLDLVVYEVHLSPYHKHQCLLVNDDSNPLVFNYLIHLPNLLLFHVVHHIAIPVAASPSDIYFHSIEFSLVLLIIHELFNSICGVLGLKIL